MHVGIAALMLNTAQRFFALILHRTRQNLDPAQGPCRKADSESALPSVLRHAQRAELDTKPPGLPTPVIPLNLILFDRVDCRALRLQPAQDRQASGV
jgi:hypothetical protein